MNCILTNQDYILIYSQKIQDSTQPLEEALMNIKGNVQSKPLNDLCQEEAKTRVAEIDRVIAQIKMKLEELERARKAYLDREDQVNAMSARKSQMMIEIRKRGKETTRREAARRRYPKRNIKQKNYAELEVPDEDHFLFCDDCNTEYLGDCPVHGPLVIIKDTITKG